MSGAKELLDQSYLENKVNSILEPMVMKLVSLQPENPADFMIKWIKQNYGDRPSTNQNKRFELEFLRKEIAKIDGEEHKSDSDSSDSDFSKSESSDDEAILKARNAKQQKGWKPRQSVSAEVYGDWNKKEAFKPRVIEKDKDTVEKIKSKILKSFMFGNLSEADLQVVINAMNVVDVNSGDYVIKEGDAGDEMYLVGTGKYSCTKVFPGNTEPTFLRYYVPGEAFGELCLLYNCPRAASIQCLDAGTLYALDRATFNHIVKDSAIRRRNKYEEFLKSVELLQGMDAYDRVSLADGVIEQTFSTGDYIIRQGEKGDRFFFVVEGSAVATKRLEPGKAPVEVMQYDKGSYFGELALLNDAPRAANVIAKTKTHVVSLDKDTFKRIMGPGDELLQMNIKIYEKYGYLDKDVHETNNIR